MNRMYLFCLLRRNVKLSEKRSPLFEQNKVSSIFIYIGVSIMCIYLIAIGTMLGWATRGGDWTLILGAMPLMLPIDFFIRFGSQQTPTMLIKPYLLMPVKSDRVIDSFIWSSLISTNNFIWFALFLPYIFLCFCGGMPFVQSLLLLLVCFVLILINSQWYMLVRTLINHKIWWWALPISIYALVLLPVLFDFEKGVEQIFNACIDYGFTLPLAAVYIAAFSGLLLINRVVQRHFVYEEIARVEKTKLKHVSQFTFLNRFGQIGEYLKLEIKSTMRNKAIKQRFISGVCVITMLSGMLAYTNAYEGVFAVNMWCLYCFLFFGAVNLVKLMGPEGNYIDLLMVHKENILALLKAKYYFYLAILFLPFIILLPPIISGKFTPMMVLAYLLVTAGPNYFLLFQLAVYNKQTLALNNKVTGKGNFENTLQLIIEGIVFFLPVLVNQLLTALFDETTAYSILIITGALFVLTYPLWMRNIYKRMMVRRYRNLEGFHETR